MPLHRFAERIFEIQTSKGYYLADQIGPTDKTNFGFDVVLSSGVMYHVLNPIDHLMTYRKLCKLGGLVVIETAVAISDEVSFFHVIRPEETLYANDATWFVTTAAIDLFLRACFLRPLAFCYISRQKCKSIEIARLGVVVRAVSTRPFDPQRYQELLNSEVFSNQDLKGLQPAALLTGRVSKPLSLRMNGLYSAENGMPVSAFNSTEPLPTPKATFACLSRIRWLRRGEGRKGLYPGYNPVTREDHRYSCQAICGCRRDRSRD